MLLPTLVDLYCYLVFFNVTDMFIFGVMNSWQISTIYFIFSPSFHRWRVNHLITFEGEPTFSFCLSTCESWLCESPRTRIWRPFFFHVWMPASPFLFATPALFEAPCPHTPWCFNTVDEAVNRIVNHIWSPTGYIIAVTITKKNRTAEFRTLGSLGNLIYDELDRSTTLPPYPTSLY